jgi:uncharacterized protein (DUF4415 family)
MTTDNLAPLTDGQLAQLKGLEGRAPDTSDIPEAPAENWRASRKFFRPLKEPISIRVDADVLNWVKHRSDRYQVEINRILRQAMESDLQGRTAFLKTS